MTLRLSVELEIKSQIKKQTKGAGVSGGCMELSAHTSATSDDLMLTELLLSFSCRSPSIFTPRQLLAGSL